MKNYALIVILVLSLMACSEDSDDNPSLEVAPTLTFTHNWDGSLVTNADFNAIQYTNTNGEQLSIERLRYVISDIVFTNSNNETIELDVYNLVDLTNANNLSFTPETTIPSGTYTVSFTFGLDNEDNSDNYLDLNSESFNVPDMLGGGYHYMQFDGKFTNSSMVEQGFNYHVIRAVDNPGANPTFPQDTFFTVNLGSVTVTQGSVIEVRMNIAEWFKNPNAWDLNTLNQMLMPNSAAQIMMNQNGQNVFSLGAVTEVIDN